MSSLTTIIQSIKSEVKIDDQGKVSMTQYAVSQLLQISHVFLTRNDYSKKLAENLAAVGFQLGTENPPGHLLNEAQVAVIIEYYAFDAKYPSKVARQIYRAMASVGIRAFFQHQLGWQPQPNPQSDGGTDLTQLQSIINAAQDALNARKAAANQPGVSNILEHLMQPSSGLLEGTITLQEFLAQEYPNTTFTLGEMCHIGRGCAQAHRATYGTAPGKTYYYVKRDDGTKYPKASPKFPLSFRPQMQNVVELSLNSSRLK